MTKCPAFWCAKEVPQGQEHTGDAKYAKMQVRVYCGSCKMDVKDAAHADHEGLQIFLPAVTA